MQQIIDIVQRLMEELDVTILGLLCGAFTFILGVIISQYKLEECFHHRRVWSRLAVSLGLLILAVCMNSYVEATLVFLLLVCLTIFLPLPHELLIIYYYKSHLDNLDKGKYRGWLVTTSAKLRFYALRIKACHDEVDRQNVQVEFLDEAKKWDLFDYEYKQYYLPHLDVLFKIGAVKAFESECVRLSRFKDNSYMLCFQTYLAHNAFDYEKMVEYESKNTDTSDESQLVSLLNLLCAYEASGEKEKMKPIVAKLLEYKKKGIIHIEMYRDLMHYYDEILCDKVAGDRLADEIVKMKLARFGDFLNLLDVAFMHYRREGNQAKINTMLDKILSDNDLMQHGENQLITRIKLMYVIFDNGYKWQEYSLKLFFDRERYLKCSYRVGALFVKESLRLIRDVNALTGKGLQQNLLSDMFVDFSRNCERYLSEIDSDLATLDERFLYRYISLLMLKQELLKFMADDDLVLVRKNNDEIFERIRARCEHNGNQRELLHFLVVQIDDILSMNKQILDYVSANKQFTLSQKFIDYKSHWDAYFNYAENLICDVVKILQSRNYDKSLAYYVLYTAYFYNLIGNGKRSVFFLSQFERYGVDLKNWTVPIQDLYAKIAISKTSKI